jgi:carbon starvation protein
MSPLANKLFLAFIWLTLVYVLVVFLDLTAATFAPRVPAGMDPEAARALAHRGGGVASSSVLFILLALGLGSAIYRFKVPLSLASVVFVPLMFLGIWGGQQLPILPAWMPAVRGSATTTWSLVLLLYCLVASVAPVWVLLQPRDYLSSFLLYACLGGGLLGIVASTVVGGPGLALSYPAYLGFHSDKLGYLFPALFITIACGACSGFHSVVASGTTAKQLDRERDARVVGYGGMLLEGVLALVAVSTVAVASVGSPQTRLAPPAIFAGGLGRFLALLGVPAELGHSFGLLALSTFLLTTLDTGTRLGRYVLEELLELRGRGALWISSLATLALPLLFSLMTFHDAAGKPVPVWRVIWPVFGSTNQLLGGLALMVITVWLRRAGRALWYTLLPMLLMLSATLLSLGQLIWQHGLGLIGGIAAALFVMAVILLLEAIRSLLGPVPARA